MIPGSQTSISRKPGRVTEANWRDAVARDPDFAESSMGAGQIGGLNAEAPQWTP